MSGIKLGGQWKTPSLVYTKVNGQWTIVAQTFAKVGGVWKTTTFGSPPDQPQVAYVTTGVFEITNYDPTLVYEATLVSGTGTATFNASNGRYTLSGANSRFSVVAKYAVGAPASDPAYIERKAYTYYTETYTTTCTGTRTVAYDCSYTVNEYYFCCGDACVNGLCPPQDGWFCNGGTCCTNYCVRTVTVPQTCYRQETYTYSCTATRQVRNPTPAGYTDSGVEWYRLD